MLGDARSSVHTEGTTPFVRTTECSTWRFKVGDRAWQVRTKERQYEPAAEGRSCSTGSPVGTTRLVAPHNLVGQTRIRDSAPGGGDSGPLVRPRTRGTGRSGGGSRDLESSGGPYLCKYGNPSSYVPVAALSLVQHYRLFWVRPRGGGPSRLDRVDNVVTPHCQVRRGPTSDPRDREISVFDRRLLPVRTEPRKQVGG